jgi:hypothetical protein
LSNHFLTYGIQFGLKIFSPKIENYKIWGVKRSDKHTHI